MYLMQLIGKSLKTYPKYCMSHSTEYVKAWKSIAKDKNILSLKFHKFLEQIPADSDFR